MRHRKSGIKLGRTTSHRDAMFRNMVTSLLKHDRIRTTDTKAKELRRWADHIITLAKRGDLHARRMALSIVREKDVVHKLFETAGDRFGEIWGGYTRIVKIGRRPGDAAPMSIIELVGPEAAPKKRKKKKGKPPIEAAAAVAAPVKAGEEVAAEAKEGDEPTGDGQASIGAAAESQDAGLSTDEQETAEASAPVEAQSPEATAVSDDQTEAAPEDKQAPSDEEKKS